MNRSLSPCGFGFARPGGWLLLLALLLPLRGLAAISQGPEPQNAVEAQQRQKLLFDQAILSNQEKLRVGRERYEQRLAERASLMQAMTAQLQARQQIVTIQPAAAAQPLAIFDPSQWLKPALTVSLLLVVFICFRYLHLSRKREQAAAEREKLF